MIWDGQVREINNQSERVIIENQYFKKSLTNFELRTKSGII